MENVSEMRKIVGGILCGGYGKRLWPLTNTVPKVLLEISKEYTILDRQLSQLKNIGIKNVYLLAGYLHEKIRERYGDEWRGLRINYFIEEEPGGTLYAINNLLGNVESDFYIVMNGDIVTDINLLRMLKNADENTVSMAITKLKSPYGIVNISENRIIGFEEKPELPYFINAGIYVISKKLKNRFLTFKRGDVEKLVFPLLAKEGLLKYYFEKDVLWYSVDSHKDLETVRSEFSNREDMPWGYVKTIVLTEKYMVRKVYIMEGFATPMYIHTEKDESIHVVSGKGKILLEDNEIQIKEGDIVRIRPGQKHSITALENLTLMEYSTPHPADRVEVK
ncbi:MAG: sugar phosphate nucleotidyltransferase [Thermoproteota archaeon]